MLPRFYVIEPAMPKVSTRNLHVPLPEPLHRRLRAEAERVGRPATELAREAIDRWLDEQQRLLVREAIREYASHVAGSGDDLDDELEAAAVERLMVADEDAGS
jgi:predicted DNA-binding protein